MYDTYRFFKDRLLLATCAACLLAFAGCEQANTTAPPPGETRVADAEVQALADEAPLLLDDEPLLLLDDEPTTEDPDRPQADNSRCFVCHVNYMQEQIAVTHARADIGCAHCHGPSDAHIADESWASGGNGTAPDTMYPLDTIKAACMTCHPKTRIDIPQHDPMLTEDGKRVCTDCHGNHRLPQRRSKWK